MKLKYDKVLTARNASRALDACKVDIAFVPYLIQCKAGYARNRPKADVIFKEMRKLLAETFPKEEPIHNYPPVLIHKISGKDPSDFLVTMQYNDWLDLILNSNE